MNNLHLFASSRLPEVHFDAKTGVMKISGRCLSEFPEPFFVELGQWLSVYFENPKALTQFIIRLEFLNSSSTKQLLSMFKLVDTLKGQSKVEVQWEYEQDDELILELGEQVKCCFLFNFMLIPY